MPTVIPAPRTPLPTWRQVPRLAFLLAQACWLSRRLLATHRAARVRGEYGDDRLLGVARRWLACHEILAALLGVPEPPQVRQVRIALGESHVGEGDPRKPPAPG